MKFLHQPSEYKKEEKRKFGLVLFTKDVKAKDQFCYKDLCGYLGSCNSTRNFNYRTTPNLLIEECHLVLT